MGQVWLASLTHGGWGRAQRTLLLGWDGEGCGGFGHHILFGSQARRGSGGAARGAARGAILGRPSLWGVEGTQ